MLRTLSAALALCIASTCTAADLPKNISTIARAEWVKKWQPTYAAEREKRQARVEEGRTLAKFAATKKEGEALLIEATAALKDFEARPWIAPGAPIEVIGEKEPTAGAVCGFAVLRDEFAVGEVLPEGVLVECVVPRKGKVTIARYLIASPIELPKKKDATMKLPGMWYCAGTADVKGKTVPVLYRFELSKDDFPPVKPDK